MRVLVLCHGNICRSPFAAAAIASLRPGWTVTSAGLGATPGRRAAKKAREAAERYGLDISNHRSARATPDMLSASDVILHMDGGNLRRLRVMGCERSTCLADWGGAARVPDPNFTSDPARLTEIFGLLHRASCAFADAPFTAPPWRG